MECEHTKFLRYVIINTPIDITLNCPWCPPRPGQKKKLWEVIKSACKLDPCTWDDDYWNDGAEAAKAHIISELPSVDDLWLVYMKHEPVGMKYVLTLIKERINNA